MTEDDADDNDPNGEILVNADDIRLVIPNENERIKEMIIERYSKKPLRNPGDGTG